MAALLTCDRDNTDKVVRYIHEARTMGIEILPPDVNESSLDFSISAGAIRFGLGAVKNVGEGAILSILKARDEDGPFESLMDFCERVDLRKVNKRVLEGLVKCGAFDTFGYPRDLLFHNIERALERGQSVQRDREAGQFSLFGALESTLPAESGDSALEELAEEDEWTQRMELRFERASLGFYITGHPLDRYVNELPRLATGDTSTLVQSVGKQEVSFGAMVVGLRERQLKDGSGRMAFLQLEDHLGQVEGVCFSKTFMANEDLLKSDDPVLISGQVRLEGDGEEKVAKLRISGVTSLAQVRREQTRSLTLRVGQELLNASRLAALKRALGRFPGPCTTRIELVSEESIVDVKCGEAWNIDPCDELLGKVERVLGKGTANFG